MAKPERRKNRVFLCLVLGLWQSAAFASDEEQGVKRLYIEMTASRSCPMSEQVEAELLPLLAHWTVVRSAEGAHEIAHIRDRESAFEVSIVGDTRVVDDTERDCEERARVAAVIIALRLEPLSSGPQESEPPLPESQPEELVEGALGLTFDLGMGVLMQKSLDQRGGPGAGPLLSLILKWEDWLIASSVALQSSHQIAETEGAISVTRFPMDLGVGRRFLMGNVSVEPSLLVALDNFRISATRLETGAPQGRLEIGPRGRVHLVYRKSALRPFAAVGLSYFPRDYSVRIDPYGEVARTPRYYFDASVGFFVPLLGR
jgi:hypothetical protein